MQKKKVLLLLSVLTLAAFSIAGCGKKQDASQQYLDDPVEVTSSDPVEVSEDDYYGDADGVGQVAVLPSGTGDNAAMAGTNAVTFYFKNPSVTIGTGNVAVINMTDFSILSSVSVSDAGRTESEPMSADELSSFGWDSGEKISVFLDSCFLSGQAYAIRTDPGCFMAGDTPSKAITDNNVTFTTKYYGINVSSLPSTVAQGSSLKVPVLVGGGASLARADGATNCTVGQTSFTANGDMNISFDNTGTASLSLTFTSADGHVVDVMPLNFTVVAAN